MSRRMVKTFYSVSQKDYFSLQAEHNFILETKNKLSGLKPISVVFQMCSLEILSPVGDCQIYHKHILLITKSINIILTILFAFL